MVQRYEFKDVDASPYHPYYEMVKSDKGDWVGYEDYKELERKFNELRVRRVRIPNDAFDSLARAEKAEAELQKYKDQFPDYVECANCGSVTHVEGVEDAMGQSGCRKEDAKECEHVWNRYIVHPHRKICLVCGVKE